MGKIDGGIWARIAIMVTLLVSMVSLGIYQVGEHDRKIEKNASGNVVSIGYITGGGASDGPYKNLYYVRMVSNLKLIKDSAVTYDENTCFMDKSKALSYAIDKKATVSNCLVQPAYWSLNNENFLGYKEVKGEKSGMIDTVTTNDPNSKTTIDSSYSFTVKAPS